MNYFTLFLLSITTLLSAGVRPEQVVVVANSKDEKSLAIAEHYLKERQIPRENLFLVDTYDNERISWGQFVTSIYNPLRAALFEAGWIQGTLSTQKDVAGRYQSVAFEHRIDYLVLCRIPLKISDDKTIMAKEVDPRQKAFKTNRASVDGELALMAKSGLPTVGFVRNVLYQQKKPGRNLLNQVIRVARLDGPTEAIAKGLVSQALEAESVGLHGRAYVDVGGKHKAGDVWLKSLGKQLEAFDYPVSWDHRRGKLFGLKDRMDAPALYFGWYTGQVQMPFKDKGFRFVPGAIGFHLHSFSAGTVRRDDRGWVGPLLARGAAVSMGNVYEPYLELTHHVDLFIEALIEGKTIGEAAYYSLPGLSWQATVVGDPLYRPFLVSLAEQKEKLPELSPLVQQYVVLREVAALARVEGAAAALKYARLQSNRYPGLALGYKIASLALENKDKKTARQALGFAAYLSSFEFNEQALARLIADQLNELGEREQALRVYTALMNSRLSDASLMAYGPDAVSFARRQGKYDLAEKWDKKIAPLLLQAEEKRREREEAKKKKKK